MSYYADDYGIVFDLPKYNESNSTYTTCFGANPDIAGIGVVLSFVIAALLTTIASVAAALLDAAIGDEKAFLPKSWKRWLNRGLSEMQKDRRRYWRRTLDRLILAFADQQLVTGFALLICGYVFAFPGSHGGTDSELQRRHWNLVVYLVCLSSSTHLACVLTLRKYFADHKESGVLRLVLIVHFSLLLIPSIIMSYGFRVFLIPLVLLVDHQIQKEYNKGKTNFDSPFALWYGFQAIVLLYLFYAAIMQLLPERQKKLRSWVILAVWPKAQLWLGLKYLSRFFLTLLGPGLHDWLKRAGAATFWYLVFLTPGTVFVVQICFSLTALVYSLLQKFLPATTFTYHYSCGLNNRDENVFGFGQLLALILLALPILSAWETYIEEKHRFEHRHGQMQKAPANSPSSSSGNTVATAQTPISRRLTLAHSPIGSRDPGSLGPMTSIHSSRDNSRTRLDPHGSALDMV